MIILNQSNQKSNAEKEHESVPEVTLSAHLIWDYESWKKYGHTLFYVNDPVVGDDLLNKLSENVGHLNGSVWYEKAYQHIFVLKQWELQELTSVCFSIEYV